MGRDISKALCIISSVIIIYLSIMDNAWWVLEGGREGGIFKVLIAPKFFKLNVLGESVRIPALEYGIYAFMLALIIPSILTIIGALTYERFGRDLISIGPGVLIIIFPVLIYIASMFLERMLGFKIPISGSTIATISLSRFGYEGVVKLPINALLTLWYWLALISSILLIIGWILIRRA